MCQRMFVSFMLVFMLLTDSGCPDIDVWPYPVSSALAYHIAGLHPLISAYRLHTLQLYPVRSVCKPVGFCLYTVTFSNRNHMLWLYPVTSNYKRKIFQNF
jgi:hypothetical protein